MNLNNSIDNYYVTEYLYRKSALNNYPISGTFELTPLCNFSCRMCYIVKTPEEMKKLLRSPLTYDDWIKIAEEAKAKGMLYLMLTGGEPFIYPQFLKLYKELIKMGFIISINTNGSLINDEIIECLKKYPPRRLNITLYGINDDSYSKLCRVKSTFGKVDRAIKALTACGISVKLNCSLTPYNISDLDGIIKYAKDNGLPLDATSYMFPPIRKNCLSVGDNEARFSAEEAAEYRIEIFKKQFSKDYYISFLKDIINGKTEPPGLDDLCEDPIDGKVRCRAGKAAFWITWDGFMTPCGMMPEPKVDLKKFNFESAWEQIVEKTNEIRLSGVCGKCTNRDICHVCAAMAYAETGSMSGIPKYLCNMTKEMQRIALKELKELNC